MKICDDLGFEQDNPHQSAQKLYKQTEHKGRDQVVHLSFVTWKEASSGGLHEAYITASGGGVRAAAAAVGAVTAAATLTRSGRLAYELIDYYNRKTFHFHFAVAM